MPWLSRLLSIALLLSACTQRPPASDAGLGPADAGPLPPAGDGGLRWDAGLPLDCAVTANAGLPCLRSDAGAGTCCEGTCYVLCPVRTACAPGQDGDSCGSAGDGDGYCCAGQCLHRLNPDHENCGACGVRCSADERCESDHCEALPYSACAADTAGAQCRLDGGGPGRCCDTGCEALNRDPANCGRCGKGCATGSACLGGACTFPDAGPADCLALGCGAGTTCSAVSRECVAASCTGAPEGGACSFGPGRDGTCCGGACVDTAQDPANCLRCGQVSPAGICFAPYPARTCLADGGCADPEQSCNQGWCVYADCTDSRSTDGRQIGPCLLPSGRTGYCEHDYVCHDLLSDPQSCGTWGRTCPGGQSCVGGRCAGDDPGCGLGRAGGWCDGGGYCSVGACLDPDGGS